jgi:hypothetical protein
MEEEFLIIVTDNHNWETEYEGQPFRTFNSKDILKNWIKKIGKYAYKILYINKEKDVEALKKYVEKGAPILLLGAKTLYEANKLNIKGYLLPHPRDAITSLRRRVFIDGRLRNCRKYIKGEKYED